MHVMKDPTDLDAFSPDQIELTRIIDREGKTAILGLIANAMQTTVMAGMVLTAKLPGPAWQRAAYEAHQIALSTGDIVRKGEAELIWLYARFLQDCGVFSESQINNPEIRARMEAEGQSLPQPERE